MMSDDSRVLDQTTNAKELDYYENLAHQWWRLDGSFWPLHRLNHLRVAWVIQQLISTAELPKHRPLSGLTVLDIGCGGGILSESLAHRGATVTAIDVVEKNLHIARCHKPDHLNIDYQLKTVASLAQEQHQFDVVFNMEVIEHVDQWQQFMLDCNRLVKPGGFIFLATINRHWLAQITAIWAAEYLLKWLPKGTHQFSKFRQPQELVDSLKKDKIELLEQIGVGVNPIRKSMFLTRNMRINYMLFGQKQPIAN